MKYALLLGSALVAAPAVANAQAQPVYVQPAPVYAPPPTYVQPQPTYIAPMYPGRRHRVVMDYNGGPIPPGAILRTRRLTGLAVAGAATFGVSYLISVFTALIAGSSTYYNPGTQWLYVPVAGPWIMLTSNVGPQDRPILIFDGILQGAGALSLILGFAISHQELIMWANDDGEHPHHARASHPLWAVLPGAPGAPAGLTLSVANF